MDTNIGGAWIWRKMAGGKPRADVEVMVDEAPQTAAESKAAPVDETPQAAVEAPAGEVETPAVEESPGLFAEDTESAEPQEGGNGSRSKERRRKSSPQS